MIQFGNQDPWPTTFDQEGNLITPAIIQQERLDAHQKEFNKKKAAFERMLSDRAEKTNEVYRDLGFDRGIQAQLYQYGMEVHAVKVMPDGIITQVVGRAG